MLNSQLPYCAVLGPFDIRTVWVRQMRTFFFQQTDYRVNIDLFFLPQTNPPFLKFVGIFYFLCRRRNITSKEYLVNIFCIDECRSKTCKSKMISLSLITGSYTYQKPKPDFSRSPNHRKCQAAVRGSSAHCHTLNKTSSRNHPALPFHPPEVAEVRYQNTGDLDKEILKLQGRPQKDHISDAKTVTALYTSTLQQSLRDRSSRRHCAAAIGQRPEQPHRELFEMPSRLLE
jgi:hypothetical protein